MVPRNSKFQPKSYKKSNFFEKVFFPPFKYLLRNQNQLYNQFIFRNKYKNSKYRLQLIQKKFNRYKHTLLKIQRRKIVRNKSKYFQFVNHLLYFMEGRAIQ